MRVITAKDVGQRLRKSFKWVYQNAAALGALRIGRSVIFTEEALADALDAAREKTREDSERINGTYSEPREKALQKKKPQTFKPMSEGEDPYGLLSRLQ
jgi:hypothetical protein